MKKRNIVIIILLVFLLLISSFVGYYIYAFYRDSHVAQEPNTISNIDEEKDENGEKLNLQEVKGITNILLIGSDARPGDDTSRSDSIMILTIDNVHKKIKTTSVQRDSYVNIPGHSQQKINGAFAYGGARLLEKTLELNFKLKIDNYVIINFDGFKNIIDAIGGIDVEIKDYEINEINKYILDAGGSESDFIKKPGDQHLNGSQSLSFSRIRKVGNGTTYERDERQRLVVSKLVDKLKSTNPLKYPSILSSIFPYIKTNLGMSTILNLAYTTYSINNTNIESLSIPLEQISWGGVYGNKGWVFIMDKEQNAKIMKEFIFDDKKVDTSKLDYASFRKAMAPYKINIK
ncbi:transcriptional attenuator, LytR family [Clostridium amylolyticum]|uniref:Transcriptional attenuator, LytR family n=1 Tax=Clostridium amylolyticum TaxID=1121298 RepID=A0A1M6MP00_9CLOT|nr:LCP family protein [Clostridium amylolyticum]SHJ85172.1 transcriptional attenuator, LytR family [Clostridium amylolyticum]